MERENILPQNEAASEEIIENTFHRELGEQAVASTEDGEYKQINFTANKDLVCAELLLLAEHKYDGGWLLATNNKRSFVVQLSASLNITERHVNRVLSEVKSAGLGNSLRDNPDDPNSPYINFQINDEQQRCLQLQLDEYRAKQANPSPKALKGRYPHASLSANSLLQTLGDTYDEIKRYAAEENIDVEIPEFTTPPEDQSREELLKNVIAAGEQIRALIPDEVVTEEVAQTQEVDSTEPEQLNSSYTEEQMEFIDLRSSVERLVLEQGMNDRAGRLALDYPIPSSDKHMRSSVATLKSMKKGLEIKARQQKKSNSLRMVG